MIYADASKEDGQAGGGPGGQQQELRRTESDGVIKKVRIGYIGLIFLVLPSQHSAFPGT